MRLFWISLYIGIHKLLSFSLVVVGAVWLARSPYARASWLVRGAVVLASLSFLPWFAFLVAYLLDAS